MYKRQDQIIPVRHANNAARLAPSARVEVIPNAAHFPHKDHPQRFVRILNDFIRSTEPATYDRDGWRELLEAGPRAVPSQAEAGDAPVAPVRVLSTGA